MTTPSERFKRRLAELIMDCMTNDGLAFMSKPERLAHLKRLFAKVKSELGENLDTTDTSTHAPT